MSHKIFVIYDLGELEETLKLRILSENEIKEIDDLGNFLRESNQEEFFELPITTSNILVVQELLDRMRLHAILKAQEKPQEQETKKAYMLKTQDDKLILTYNEKEKTAMLDKGSSIIATIEGQDFKLIPK